MAFVLLAVYPRTTIHHSGAAERQGNCEPLRKKANTWRFVKPAKVKFMSDPFRDADPVRLTATPAARARSRISVPEIAQRLDIGRLAVYSMLEQGIIPGIRLGRRWIVTRHAYEQWERTCGMRSETGLQTPPEVTVLN
jgi:excisionase family DNA binding protein